MKTALLIIDLQNDYFPGGKMELVGIEKAAENADAILNYFRERNSTIIHIQHISLKKDATFFLPNTLGVEINNIVKPNADELIIQKNFPNSFRNTNLEIKLREAGVSNLIICGAMSHMCIDATTRAAFDLGFICTVICDACATRDLIFRNQVIESDQVHASFMSALGSAYAKVCTLEEYLEID